MAALPLSARMAAAAVFSLLLHAAAGWRAASSRPSSSSSSDPTAERVSHWRPWTFGPSFPSLIIGGVFSVDGRPQALARYIRETNSWSTEYEPSLYLYGASSGVVFDIKVNQTAAGDDLDLFGRSEQDEIVVVGAFDTICQTCQAQYCSVARWDGSGLFKVGEGLCPRASDSAIRIVTTALGKNGDMFVGGSFTSRVWNGQDFVTIQDVAWFVGEKQLWLPLAGGSLGCLKCNTTRILALAWDNQQEALYVGGTFDTLGGKPIPPGLVVWDSNWGLRSLPLPYGSDPSAGETWLGSADGEEVTVSHLHFEPSTGNLYVAGHFSAVGGVPCVNVAVWRRDGRWHCLSSSDTSFAMERVQAMAVLTEDGDTTLFLAGVPAASSNWTATTTDTPTTTTTDSTTTTPTDNSSSTTTTTTTTGPAPVPPSPPSPGSQQPAGSSEGEGERKRHAVAMASVVTQFSLAAGLSDPHGRSLRKRHRSGGGSSGDDDSGGGGGSADGTGVRGQNVTIITSRWSWLPGHQGSDLPIYSIIPGGSAVEGAVFMGGETSAASGVQVWMPGEGGGRTTLLGRPGQISGVIYSMVQAQLSPGHPATVTWSFPRYSWGLFAVSIFAGLVLGLLAAFVFRYQGDIRGYKAVGVREDGKGGIPLTSLAPGISEVDLAVSYGRAMEHRHLGNRHNLTIIDPAEIVLQRIIGEGSFGRVWRATWRSSEVAIKEFFFRQSALSTDASQKADIIEEIVGEAAIMSYLRHPKILTLYGCSLTAQAIWIVSELCNLGSLRQLLDDHSVKLSLSRRLRLALDVAEGMVYLHTREPPIIHRDIKSQNLFVSRQGPVGELTVKIGDWGSARAIALGGKGTKTMTIGTGTAGWLAPEVIRHAQGSKSTDVYAFGIVLWELATREEVHAGLSAAQIIVKVAHENLRPPVPRMCPWAHLMMDCWHEDPSKRPPFQDIVIRLSRLLTRVLQAEERRRQAAAAASLSTSSSSHPSQHRQQQQATPSEATPLTLHQLSASFDFDASMNEDLEHSSTDSPLLSPPSSTSSSNQATDTAPTPRSGCHYGSLSTGSHRGGGSRAGGHSGGTGSGTSSSDDEGRSERKGRGGGGGGGA